MTNQNQTPNFKSMNKGELIRALELQEKNEVANQRIFELQQQLSQEKERVIKTKEARIKELSQKLINETSEFTAEERFLIAYVRTSGFMRLSNALEWLIDSLFFSDRPIDQTEREMIIPLIEIKENLRLN